MISLTSEAIELYARAHSSTPHPVYARLHEYTLAKAEMPQMQSGPSVGRFLMLLAKLVGAKNAVEIGTFTGYSALSIAEGMPEDGRLVTCDIDPHSVSIAERFFAEVPWGKRIEVRLGPALDTLRTLPGPFDFAFIDADKSGYPYYWDAVVEKLRPGGVVVVDNVLWSGRVLDPQEESDHAIAAFNRHAKADERIDGVMLTVRDGLLMGVKK